jgi:hypothetical protein
MLFVFRRSEESEKCAIQSRNRNPNYELQRGLLKKKMFFVFVFYKHDYIKLSFFAIISLINIIPIQIIDIAKFTAKLLFSKCLKY